MIDLQCRIYRNYRSNQTQDSSHCLCASGMILCIERGKFCRSVDIFISKQKTNRIV
jgi:hypothetical protein